MKISQAEARRLRKRVKELEEQRSVERRSWSTDFPGMSIGTLKLEKDWFWGACKMARRLGRVLVVTVAEDGTFSFYAAK